jgi:hypothetical protein
LPILFNAAFAGLLMAYINAKIDGVDAKFEAKFDGVNTRIDALWNEMNARFEAQTHALFRVEGVLDARMKHFEDRD